MSQPEGRGGAVEIRTQHLHQVVTIERCGSFAAASRSLAISQPALTRSIQAFEREVGFRIFERSRRGVTPTALGERVLARARLVLGELSDLRRELEVMRDLGTGRIVVGAGPVMRSRPLRAALGATVRRHPDLEIEIRLGVWTELTPAVLSREIDLFIGELSEAEGDDRLEIVGFAGERGAWLVRAGHPLAGRSRLGRRDLRAFPMGLLHFPARLHPVFRSQIGDECDGAGLVWCDDLDLLKGLALECDAIVLLSRELAASEIERGELVALDVRGRMPSTRPGAVWLRSHPLSPVARDLVDEIRARAGGPDGAAA